MEVLSASDIVDACFIALVDICSGIATGVDFDDRLIGLGCSLCTRQSESWDFSMMAFYVNLALFASNPGTRYLNELLLVTHEGTGPYTRNGSRLFITVRSSGLCRSNFSDSASGGNHLV